MRIIFNLKKVGLGNNGGSRTIIKSAETLASLGQEVVIYSDISNKYTWETLKNNVQFIKSKKIPKGDVIIATGIGSVKSTIISNFKKKFYYIRGFEIWAAKKDILLKSYKSLKCIVNSGWLQKMLADKGIKSDLIFNGLDFDDFYNISIDRRNSLGCLFHKKHKTKNYSFVKKSSDNGGIPLLSLNKDIKNPTPQELNKWYNTIKVWVASSELEGLHNPPMEASLSGCGLVTTNHPRSGTQDYSIHEYTSLVYSHGDKKDALKCFERLINDDKLRETLNTNMVELLKTKIGTREANMMKMLEVLL